jgi:flagellar assembly protein FliH
LDINNKVLIETAAIETEEPEENLNEMDMLDENASPQELAINTIVNANKKSESIINDALKKADDIIQNAIKQAEQEGKKIIDEIREQGYREGIRNAESEGSQIRAQAEQVLNDARMERKSIEESTEPDMVDLIIKITAKLLDNAVRLNPAVVLNLIKQGLSGATLTGDVMIHVSPHDYDVTANNKEAIQAMAEGSVRIEIKRDPSLNPMDCVIETPFGNIDCSLGQQFENLCHNLAYVLNFNAYED